MRIKRGLALYLIAPVILGIGIVFLVAPRAGADPIVLDSPGTYECEEIIEVSSSEAGIVITADDVTLLNCEITSATGELGDVGIVVLGADHVIVHNNTIHDLLEGIRLIGVDDTTIRSNTIYNIGQEIPGVVDPRTGICIHLEDSHGNKLWGNECYDSGEGLFLRDSYMNSVEDDFYHDNAFGGVHLEDSGGNEFGVEDLDMDGTIEGVTVTGNGSWGFYLIDSHGNVIQRSEVYGNNGGGIKLEGSDDNTIGCVSGSHCGNYIRDNGDGADEDINVLLTKGVGVLFYLDPTHLSEVQSGEFTIKGSPLVGTADGYDVTNDQICGQGNTIDGEWHCSTDVPEGSIVKILMDRLNADDELGTPGGTRDVNKDDIKVVKERLIPGSLNNIIASNVITSNVNNDEGRNVGIKLEPGSFENIVVNNLITNEDVQTPSRRGLFGKLDRGIVLLSSSNKILFNAIEFLDVGIVRGGENEREDVKHLHLFKKLALVCDADISDCPTNNGEKDWRVIVTEIEEEIIDDIKPEASVRFNRLALNFIEKNGIGIDVVDAESNLIDENLFLDNQNGGIVLSRLESSQGFWGIIDIRIEENDFKGGYSIVNLSTLPLDVSNNWAEDSLWEGGLKPPKFGPVADPGQGIEARDPFCLENFTESKFANLGDELGLSFLVSFFGDSNDTNGDFLDDVLPPNTEFLPDDVSLPAEKPRDCNPDVFPPQGPNQGSKIPQLAGTQGPPKDLDRDGLYEDVNGNGRLDFDDAVALALNLSSGIVQAHQEAFDFNHNGRVDFDDAVKLAFKVGGQAATQALRKMFGIVELKVTNVIAYSNRTNNSTGFIVEGQGIASIKVEIFNLGGMRVYDSDFAPGNRLIWHLMNGPGGAWLANGVYLYIVTVKGYTGKILRTEVRKLVVLR